MKRILLLLIIVACCCSTAEARRWRRRSRPTQTNYRPVSQPSGNAYQIALRSAQYRAAHGIHGHAHGYDSGIGRSTGVGWASNNPQPNTCLGRGGSNYAVVRGRDGFYATKIN